MFRCPSCARVWKLPLTKGYTLLAHRDLNKCWIASEPITLYSAFVPVENDLLKIAEKLDELGIELNFTAKHYLECAFCGTHSTFVAWHEAWNHPGDFFDADQLCSCGGELWYDQIPGSTKYALVCEKCGWVKPKAIISGHEGT